MKYYLKKHWKINLLVIFLQIAWGALYACANVTMMQMAQAILDLDLELFVFRFAIHVSLWAVILVFDGARNWAKSKAKLCMNNHVRADIVATLLKKNHQEFHSQQSGEYLSWFTNDVNQISALAWDSFYGIISIAAQIVTSIIALAQMHWSLLVSSVFVALVIINAPKLMGKRVEKLSDACAEKQAAAMSKMKDLLAGLDVLKFFNRTDRFVDGNQEASNQMEQPKHKLTYVRTFIGEGISFISLICQFAVFSQIGILSIKGIILPSSMMGGGNLCGTIYNGFASIGQDRLSIQASKPYFEKITVHAEAESRRSNTYISPVKDAITVENLSFQYGDKPILQNADFRFAKGGKYALTGPSGCGKSTLLKLLLGWLPEYSGTIRFDGQNARDFSTEQLQQQMSYIEQDVFLFNTTIRDNITLGENFTDELIDRAVKGSALDGDLANMSLGLDTPVGEDGSNLSGGQKQRVAIARALIHNRSILLVDEGTSALDQKNADIVERSLLENPDLTLILVSHHLSPERKAQFTKVFELTPVAV